MDRHHKRKCLISMLTSILSATRDNQAAERMLARKILHGVIIESHYRRESGIAQYHDSYSVYALPNVYDC